MNQTDKNILKKVDTQIQTLREVGMPTLKEFLSPDVIILFIINFHPNPPKFNTNIVQTVFTYKNIVKNKL